MAPITTDYGLQLKPSPSNNLILGAIVDQGGCADETLLKIG